MSAQPLAAEAASLIEIETSAIIFDFGMRACYIPHYFGTKDKTLNAICFFRVIRVRLQESVIAGNAFRPWCLTVMFALWYGR